MLSTHSLTFSYNPETVFCFPDIGLSSDADLLLLGPSGVGKTTLLHIIGGLLLPTSGDVTLDGTVLNKLSHGKRDLYRGKHIGVVFQKARFIQSVSVVDNIRAKCFFAKAKVADAEIDALLDELGLLAHKHKRVTQLSEGQKQRLSIAVAIINKPGLILADEPTASLDAANAEKVMTLLKEQARNRKANLLVITHDERIKNHFANTLYL